jgi:hypothetical protein
VSVSHAAVVSAEPKSTDAGRRINAQFYRPVKSAQKF